MFVLRPQGDTLAIDGSGWAFQLLEGQRVDHGGDYDLLHAAVVREVSRLRQVTYSRSSIRMAGEGCYVSFLVSRRMPYVPEIKSRD